jgi:hypothetical protein
VNRFAAGFAPCRVVSWVSSKGGVTQSIPRAFSAPRVRAAPGEPVNVDMIIDDSGANQSSG